MNLFHFAIMAAFAVTVSACSSTYIVRCKEGYQLAVHDSLYFGTAKPDGVVSPADWARFLESTVTPRFPQGLTSSRTSGQWRGADRVVHDAGRGADQPERRRERELHLHEGARATGSRRQWSDL